jgi:hypothetical protein
MSNLFSQSKRPLELAHICKSVVFGKDGKGISFKNRLKGHINWRKVRNLKGICLSGRVKLIVTSGRLNIFKNLFSPVESQVIFLSEETPIVSEGLRTAEIPTPVRTRSYLQVCGVWEGWKGDFFQKQT